MPTTLAQLADQRHGSRHGVLDEARPDLFSAPSRGHLDPPRQLVGDDGRRFEKGCSRFAAEEATGEAS